MSGNSKISPHDASTGAYSDRHELRADLADRTSCRRPLRSRQDRFRPRSEAFADYIGRDAYPEMDDVALAEAVLRSLKAKQWFVEIDEFDRKERLTLNFGHTFAHAIESASASPSTTGGRRPGGALCDRLGAGARVVHARRDTRSLSTSHVKAAPSDTGSRRNVRAIDRADFEKAFPVR